MESESSSKPGVLGRSDLATSPGRLIKQDRSA